MNRRLIVRGPGLRGPAGIDGRDGLPGVNAVPADEAVAAYVADEEAETGAALRAAFVASPGVRAIEVIGQAAYDALSPKVPTTLYVVTED